jgi:DNA polymerase III epsilon subunit-like protein
MKSLFLFNDTETTGLTKKEHKLLSVHNKEQILSYAIVCCEKDEVLFEEEVKVKLKKNVLPHTKALLVNNLNPFSTEFLSIAKTEYDAAHYLANKILSYKDQGYRVVFIAYNAEYDENMISDMFIRCGINFKALIDVVFDPLLMTRPLVQKGVIKTRMISNYGKTYPSASLEDVYNGLGFSSANLTAHNALEDTKMLKSVVYKAYYLFTGRSFEDVDIDESTLIPGAEKTVAILEDHVLKLKSIKVLKRNNTGKLLVLDSERIKDSPDKIKSCVVEINANTILDELDLMSKEVDGIERYYNQYKSAIDELVENYDLVESVYGTHEQLYFGAIEKIADKKLKDPNSELTPEELEKEDWAEEYSYARFNDGWSVKLKGQNHENLPKIIEINDDIKLVLDPVGKFVIRSATEVLLEAEKKSDIISYVTTKLDVVSGTDLYKKINAALVPVKTFTSVKYPANLISDFNNEKTAVFNGSNKLHKDTLRDLRTFYQSVSQEAFKDLTIPDFRLNLNSFKK